MSASGTLDESSVSESRKQKGNNNNRHGKNQYKDRPSPDDPHVAGLLRQYHLAGISDRRQISKLLLQEHGITLSETSISRRKKQLGLRSSHLTTQELGAFAKRQLVRDQMAKDPAGKYGPRMVKQKIFEETGIHLTRDYIRDEMKKLDPVGSSRRGPAHMKAKRHSIQLASYSHDDATLVGVPPQFADLSDRDASDSPSPPMVRCDDTMDVGLPPHGSESESRQIDIASLPEPEPLPAPTLSPAMTTILDMLQGTTSNMESLTRSIRALEVQEPLDAQTYATVLKGMESAALLERQLSRLISGIRVPSS